MLLRFGAPAAAALMLAACATPDKIRSEGYLGSVDGKRRYEFQLARSQRGRASFESMVRKLSAETCDGPYREISRREGQSVQLVSSGNVHTEMHILIECLS